MPSAQGTITVRRRPLDGADGKDGQSSFKSIVFIRSTDTPATPTGGSYAKPVPTGWSDGIPPEKDGQPAWMSSRWFSSDGLSPQTNVWEAPQIVADKSDIDFEFSAVASNPGTPATNANNWHDKATSSDIWMALRTQSRGVWGAWEVSKIKGEKGDKGDKGEDGEVGNGIQNITEYYLAYQSNTGVTKDTQGWSTTIQQMTASKKYLWNYEHISYTDGNTSDSTPHIVGVYGDTGVGISNIINYYLKSANRTGITTTNSIWSTTPPVLDATNKYLWNYEHITYTNGETHNTTPAVIGVYGDKGDKGDKGDDGAQGLQGDIIRVRKWELITNGYYEHHSRSDADGNEVYTPPFYTDVVFIDNPNSETGYDAYQTKQRTYPIDYAEPGKGDRWQEFWEKINTFSSIATGLLLAKNAKIDFLQGNQILIQKSNGTICAGLAGSSTPLWIGNDTPTKAPFRVSEDGSFTSTKATITGNITVTSGKIGAFNISGSYLGVDNTLSESGAGTSGLSLFDKYIKFKDGNFSAMLGANVYPSYASGTCLLDLRNYYHQDSALNVGTNFGIRIDVSKRPVNIGIWTNAAIVSTGSYVIDSSFKYIYVPQNTMQYLNFGLDSEESVPNLFKIIVKFGAENSGLALPTSDTIWEVLSGTAAKNKQQFAVRMLIVGERNSATGLVYGRYTSDYHPEMASNKYPQILAENANEKQYVSVAKGDSIEFLLTYFDDNNYVAYTINHHY